MKGTKKATLFHLSNEITFVSNSINNRMDSHKRFQVVSIFSLLGAQRITENMIPICTFSTKKHIENYGNYSLAWPKHFWQKDLMSLNIYLIQVKTNGTVQQRVNQHHQETHQKIHSRWCLHRSLLFFYQCLKCKTQIHPGKGKKKRAVQTLTHRTYPPYVAPPKSNMGALIVSKVNWP